VRAKDMRQAQRVVLDWRPGIIVHMENGRAWVHFTDGGVPIQASAVPDELTRVVRVTERSE